MRAGAGTWKEPREEIRLDFGVLLAEARQQGFDYRPDQEDEDEVCGNAADRIIFSNFRHGSSHNLRGCF
jgi:hypothetical protein